MAKVEDVGLVVKRGPSHEEPGVCRYSGGIVMLAGLPPCEGAYGWSIDSDCVAVQEFDPATRGQVGELEREIAVIGRDRDGGGQRGFDTQIDAIRENGDVTREFCAKAIRRSVRIERTDPQIPCV